MRVWAGDRLTSRHVSRGKLRNVKRRAKVPPRGLCRDRTRRTQSPHFITPVRRPGHVSPRAPHRPAPDREAALAQYRRRAPLYDLELAAFEPVRCQAIDQLGLTRGQTVIDVGCGTGLSFERLRAAVGPEGAVIGIEQSPAMLALARERVDQGRWRNVSLVCAPTEEAVWAGQADAALFHFTHDILRRPEAIDRVLAHLRPGATVVAAGLKWAQGWAWPTNLFVWSAALYSVTSLEGLDAPWSLLERRLEALAVDTALFGAAYVARGRLRA